VLIDEIQNNNMPVYIIAAAAKEIDAPTSQLKPSLLPILLLFCLAHLAAIVT